MQDKIRAWDTVYAQERYKSVQKINGFKFLWLTREEIMRKRIQKAEKSAKEENCRAAKGGYKEQSQHKNLVRDKIKNLGYSARTRVIQIGTDSDDINVIARSR